MACQTAKKRQREDVFIHSAFFVKGGQVVDKQVGAAKKSDLIAKLEKLL